MTLKQCETLQNRIEKVIDLYRTDKPEFRISNTEVVGVLEAVKFNILSDNEDEQDDSEDWKGVE